MNQAHHWSISSTCLTLASHVRLKGLVLEGLECRPRGSRGLPDIRSPDLDPRGPPLWKGADSVSAGEVGSHGNLNNLSLKIPGTPRAISGLVLFDSVH